MTAIPFPSKRALVQPVVEVYSPTVTESGLYEAYVWKNRDRDEGFIVRLNSPAQVAELLTIIKDSFKGGAHG